MSKQYIVDSFPLWYFKKEISVDIVPDAFEIFCDDADGDDIYILTGNSRLWEYLQSLEIECRYTDKLDISKGDSLYVAKLDVPQPYWWLILL